MRSTRFKITFNKAQSYLLDPYLSFFIWVCVFLFFLVVAEFKQNIFPPYYFWDANTINNFIMVKSSVTKGDSYASTAAFYQIINVGKNSAIFPVVSSLIISGFFFLMLKKSRADKMTLLDFGMLLYCMLLANVYMTLLSKDFIVMLLIIPFVFLASRGVIGLILWSLLVLAYAYYFRVYYVLILFLFWGLYIFFARVKKPLTIIFMIFLFLFFLSVAFKAGLGVDLDNYRNMVNDVRSEASSFKVNTMIVSYIPGGGLIIGWLNVFVVWLCMMIPIPLILTFSPFYLIIAFFISMLFYRVWKAIAVELKNKNNLLMKSMLCFILAFTTIQSVFEPDYGSYVRHLSPLYPLFFYVLFVARRQNNPKQVMDNLNESISRI
ncbi:hypothetical protein SGGMMB4_02199 [Sodalis glossinidius str. 'morsitans']|uniref:Uncharacterized protein n=2 Tax=Sodalis glossinidius TaxID=63612 RepID=Q2NUB6_SODGM|nr:hypothetical protein SG0984 [Sodalis glossinidius str. 'morsitans']CRL44845.1 hypothetical protein SGGMMB4_02199 [Sodalis glossinidius str. 'morsitans']